MSFLHGTVYFICSILILFDCFISSGWFLSLSSYWIEKTELLQLHFRETHSMYFFRPKRKRPTTVPHTALHKLFSVVFSESWHPQKKSHHFRANVEMSKPSFSSKQKPPLSFRYVGMCLGVQMYRNLRRWQGGSLGKTLVLFLSPFLGGNYVATDRCCCGTHLMGCPSSSSGLEKRPENTYLPASSPPFCFPYHCNLKKSVK